MKAQSFRTSPARFFLHVSRIRLAIVIALSALIVIPLFSSSIASSIPGLSHKAAGPMRSPHNLAVAETIATFAADCTTPKTAFTFGETVCAITDGVDLNYPGGRWVHWLRQDLSIAHGGSGTTDITTNPQQFTFVPDAYGFWKVTIAETGDPSQTPAVFSVSPATTGITTYDSTCLIPKSSFNLGETVCAIVTGEPTGTPGVPLRRLNWVTRDHTVVNSNDIVTDPDVFTYTLPATPTTTFGTYVVDNLGPWSLASTSIGDAGVYASARIVVTQPTVNHVDLSVKQAVSFAGAEVDPGDGEVFEVYVRNNGPDDAQNVILSDAVPANTTFTSFVQNSGPAFTCNPPNMDGNIICTIASLPLDAEAIFTFTYQVNAGTPINTEISNVVSIESQPTGQTPDDELVPSDNTSTAFTYVSGAGTAETCSLTCRENLTVTADTTQGGNPGKFVTFTSTTTIAGSCGAITASPASGSFFPVGTTVVTVTSATGGGSCTFTITVVETPPPTITCPADQTVTAGVGETTANVNPGTPTTTPTTGVTVVGIRSDDDDDPETAPKPLNDPYPIGITNIQWTVTDTAGNKATCQQRITVNAADRDNLTISCPSDKTQAAPSGTCEATVNTGTPTTNPSDSNVTVEGVRSDGAALNAPYPAGVTTITWSATDAINGQSASCTQTITVTTDSSDNTPPTFTHVPGPVSDTTNSCGQVIEESQLGTPEATDTGNNCSPGTVTISRAGVPPGNFFPTGTTTITYTATDAAGNSATATQTVTITESPAVPPSITAPADVSVNTGPGATSCGAVVSDAVLGSASASDNCPGVTVSRSGVPAGNVFPVGNTTVTYTATDRSGNQTSDTQIVTVVDNTIPIVTPPAAVTLFTGPGATSCNVTVSDLDGTLGTGSATDNCPGVGAVSRSGVPSGNVFPVGTTTLTYSATDAHGNTDSETQVVTVIDNTAPVISCPSDIVIEPTCPTGAIATYSTPTATDNCGVQSVVRTAGLASGSVFPIGTTTVTHQATDIHGNTSSCSFTVTVLTPQAVVQNLIAAVQSSSLTGQQKNGLLSKLNAALTAMNGGGGNACAKLADFINSVGNLVSNGSLSAATGSAWTNSANNVRNTIGCTNLPCS